MAPSIEGWADDVACSAQGGRGEVCYDTVDQNDSSPTSLAARCTTETYWSQQASCVQRGDESIATSDDEVSHRLRLPHAAVSRLTGRNPQHLLSARGSPPRQSAPKHGCSPAHSVSSSDRRGSCCSSTCSESSTSCSSQGASDCFFEARREGGPFLNGTSLADVSSPLCSTPPFQSPTSAATSPSSVWPTVHNTPGDTPSWRIEQFAQFEEPFLPPTALGGRPFAPGNGWGDDVDDSERRYQWARHSGGESDAVVSPESTPARQSSHLYPEWQKWGAVANLRGFWKEEIRASGGLRRVAAGHAQPTTAFPACHGQSDFSPASAGGFGAERRSDFDSSRQQSEGVLQLEGKGSPAGVARLSGRLASPFRERRRGRNEQSPRLRGGGGVTQQCVEGRGMRSSSGESASQGAEIAEAEGFFPAVVGQGTMGRSSECGQVASFVGATSHPGSLDSSLAGGSAAAENPAGGGQEVTALNGSNGACRANGQAGEMTRPTFQEAAAELPEEPDRSDGLQSGPEPSSATPWHGGWARNWDDNETVPAKSSHTPGVGLGRRCLRTSSPDGPLTSPHHRDAWSGPPVSPYHRDAWTAYSDWKGKRLNSPYGADGVVALGDGSLPAWAASGGALFHPPNSSSKPLFSFKHVSPEERVRITRYLNLTLLLTSLAFSFGAQNLIAPNMTMIARSFHFDHIQRDELVGGTLTFLFYTPGAGGALFVGLCAGIIKRKLLFSFVVCFTAAACFATTFVTSFIQLAILRTITGLGIGGILPLAFSLIGDWFLPQQRSSASAFVMGSCGVGAFIGQCMAAVVGHIDWRWPFLFTSIPAFVMGLLFARLVAENPSQPSAASPADSWGRHRAVVRSRHSSIVRGSSCDEERGEDGEECGPYWADGGHKWAKASSHAQRELQVGVAGERCGGRRGIGERGQDGHSGGDPGGHLDVRLLREMLKRKTSVLMLLQAFPGNIPWGILIVYLHDFLRVDVGLSSPDALAAISAVAFCSFCGMVSGGFIGEELYKTRKELLCYFCTIVNVLRIFPFVILFGLPVWWPGIQGAAKYILVFCLLMFGGFVATMATPNIGAILLNVNCPQVRGTIFGIYTVLDDLSKAVGTFLVSFLVGALHFRGLAFQLSMGFWIVSALSMFVCAWTFPREEAQLLQQQKLQSHGLGLGETGACSGGDGGGCSGVSGEEDGGSIGGPLRNGGAKRGGGGKGLIAASGMLWEPIRGDSDGDSGKEEKRESEATKENVGVGGWRQTELRNPSGCYARHPPPPGSAKWCGSDEVVDARGLRRAEVSEGARWSAGVVSGSSYAEGWGGDREGHRVGSSSGEVSENDADFDDALEEAEVEGDGVVVAGWEQQQEPLQYGAKKEMEDAFQQLQQTRHPHGNSQGSGSGGVTDSRLQTDRSHPAGAGGGTGGVPFVGYAGDGGLRAFQGEEQMRKQRFQWPQQQRQGVGGKVTTEEDVLCSSSSPICCTLRSAPFPVVPNAVAPIATSSNLLDDDFIPPPPRSAANAFTMS